MAARRLHELVYATIALCCLVIIVCGVALGTDSWFKSKVIVASGNEPTEVSYGLFKGSKVKTGFQKQPYELKVICQASDNKCMYSCGKTADLRKRDLNQLIANGTADEAYICQISGTNTRRKNAALELKVDQGEPVFLNFALYALTIAFISVAIAFSALGGGLALYNTYRTPIQPILSVLGLYVWNGISAVSIIFAMMSWGIAYATSLNKNAAISETLKRTGAGNSEGRGQLGWSFWILILACLFSLTNIGILKYRSWKIIQMEAKNVRVMNTKLDSGDILLF